MDCGNVHYALVTIDESGDGTKEDEEGKKDSEAPVVEKQVRTRRRKKLIIDDIKEIDSSTMKSQLSDTSGILGTLELAPPTRKLMQLKESGGVDKLFSLTSRPLHCRFLQKVTNFSADLLLPFHGCMLIVFLPSFLLPNSSTLAT